MAEDDGGEAQQRPGSPRPFCRNPCHFTLLAVIGAPVRSVADKLTALANRASASISAENNRRYGRPTPWGVAILPANREGLLSRVNLVGKGHTSGFRGRANQENRLGLPSTFGKAPRQHGLENSAMERLENRFIFQLPGDQRSDGVGP